MAVLLYMTGSADGFPLQLALYFSSFLALSACYTYIVHLSSLARLLRFTYRRRYMDILYILRKQSCWQDKRRSNMLGTILIVVVILLLVGALPTWPHSRQWGYYPSGGLGLIFLILIILLLMGLL